MCVKKEKDPKSTDSEGEERFYVAFGPLTRAQKDAVLGVVSGNEPAMDCFVCQTKSGIWKLAGPADGERSEGSVPRDDETGPQGHLPVFDDGDYVGTDVLNRERTGDEDTLRVENLEAIAKAADHTFQNASQRQAGGVAEHTGDAESVESRRKEARVNDLTENFSVVGQSAQDSPMRMDITAVYSHLRDDTSLRITIDERRHNRVQYQVSLTLPGASNFWTGFAHDVSGGGFFVATHTTFPLGTRFDITFSLPDGKPKIHGSTQVCWLREYREGLEVPPGMRVRFLDLSNENQQRIDQFVKHREDRGDACVALVQGPR